MKITIKTQAEYKLLLNTREFGELKFALYSCAGSPEFTSEDRKYFRKLYDQLKAFTDGSA